jgi:hypothetical protein
MEKKRYTLAKFFNLDGLSKEEVQSMGDQPTFTSMGDKMQDGKKSQGGSIPPFLQGQVFRVMISKLNELLDKVDIIEDILAVTWSKSEELFDYLDTEKHPPDEVCMLPLTEHEITSEHAPSIEPYMKDQSLGKFIFNIGVNLMIQGVILEIQGGKIKKVHIGSCVGSGSIGCQDSPLLDIPEKEVEDIGGVADLGDGVAIKRGGETEEESSFDSPTVETSQTSPQSEELMAGTALLGTAAAGAVLATAIDDDRNPLPTSPAQKSPEVPGSSPAGALYRANLEKQLSLVKYLVRQIDQPGNLSKSYIKESSTQIFQKPTKLPNTTLNLLRSRLTGSRAHCLNVQMFQFKAEAWTVSYQEYKQKILEFILPITVRSSDFAWIRSSIAKSLSTFYTEYDHSPVSPWLECKTINFIISLLTIEDLVETESTHDLSNAFQIFLVNNLAVTWATILIKLCCISPKSLNHINHKLQQLVNYADIAPDSKGLKISYFYDVAQVSLNLFSIFLT